MKVLLVAALCLVAGAFARELPRRPQSAQSLEAAMENRFREASQEIDHWPVASAEESESGSNRQRAPGRARHTPSQERSAPADEFTSTSDGGFGGVSHGPPDSVRHGDDVDHVESGSVAPGAPGGMGPSESASMFQGGFGSVSDGESGSVGRSQDASGRHFAPQHRQPLSSKPTVPKGDALKMAYKLRQLLMKSWASHQKRVQQQRASQAPQGMSHVSIPQPTMQPVALKTSVKPTAQAVTVARLVLMGMAGRRSAKKSGVGRTGAKIAAKAPTTGCQSGRCAPTQKGIRHQGRQWMAKSGRGAPPGYRPKLFHGRSLGQ